MDEPMSHLDAKLRPQTRVVITRLQRRLGLTTLYVTHDHDEAMAMGDRLAVMRDGAYRAVRGADRGVRPSAQPLRRPVRRHAGDERRRGLGGRVGRRRLRAAHRRTSEVRSTIARSPAPPCAQLVGRDVALGFRAGAMRPRRPDGRWSAASCRPRSSSVRKSSPSTSTRAACRHRGSWPVDPGPRTSIVAAVDPDTPVNLWEPFRVTSTSTACTFRPPDRPRPLTDPVRRAMSEWPIRRPVRSSR